MTTTFECSACGGELAFSPGEQSLKCPYCGDVQQVPESASSIEELSFRAHIEQLADAASETEERLTVRCDACGAETTHEANVTSSECPFCGTNVVLTTRSRRLIRPGALLPFRLDRKAARQKFRRWLSRLWFAPNAVKQIASHDRLQGVYLPFWTFDCRTTTGYRGMRGDEYTDTETVTVHEGGRQVERSREVTRVRWTPVAGTVLDTFDDILVLASDSVKRRYSDRLEPWNLAELKPYDGAFLSGFRAESYRIGLEQGFALAQPTIEAGVRASVERDIGGDRQQVDSIDIDCKDVRFKHILLPVWISAYRFRDRVFQFLVNARTGEVQGERPYSVAKIFLAVAAVVAAGGLLVWALS